MMERKIVRLRAMEPEDLEVLYTVENDQELWDVGCTNVPYSKSLLRDFLMQTTGDIYTDKQVRCMVEDDHGEVVGMADLFNFDPANLRAEVGIVTLRRFRNKGYASAALRELITYSRKILCLHQLCAYVPEDNQNSLALFKDSGFVIAAELRDWIRVAGGYKKTYLMQYFL